MVLTSKPPPVIEQAGCMQGWDTYAVTHPSVNRARLCLTLLSCKNCRTLWPWSLARVSSMVLKYATTTMYYHYSNCRFREVISWLRRWGYSGQFRERVAHFWLHVVFVGGPAIS